MGKGANKNLLANSGTAQNNSATLTSRAGSLYDMLEPQLSAQATNPQGYTPEEIAAQTTAGAQSVGGSVAGAEGQGNLEAARTRNAGGYQGAIDSAHRSGMQQLAKNALSVQTNNADLKQKKQQAALTALQSLYGGDVNASLGFLNSSNQANSAENQSHPLQEGFDTSAKVIASLNGKPS